ncbi:DUF4232 domain-containing protein [Streptomyces globisporus]|uniref:DUF4232 domain-containing protein n=1 Tax=Streptomyces globisporus TaxID=1908 RepID=UPI0036B96AE8
MFEGIPFVLHTGIAWADMLKAAMSASGQETNSKYFDLTLTNTGDGPCTLQGYAGLSLTDASGAPIGEHRPSAPRTGAAEVS